MVLQEYMRNCADFQARLITGADLERHEISDKGWEIHFQKTGFSFLLSQESHLTQLLKHFLYKHNYAYVKNSGGITIY